ncbi:hypothetical protein GCM10020221_35940 [Streptomyces thioluteus]|uniref:Uncharacterized protein n=1 Tax=Streptomyces thioluteus TaxID=66431 RepID=A0ABN3X4B2_STRTU
MFQGLYEFGVGQAAAVVVGAQSEDDARTAVAGAQQLDEAGALLRVRAAGEGFLELVDDQQPDGR